jgi:hypothetical protein
MKESLTFNRLGQWDLQKSDDWMVHGDYEDRDFMPKMKGEDRTKALENLKSETQHRTNKNTGKTEYLLHRGVGEQEAWAHDDGDIDDNTSWTPHHHVAHEFSRHYNSTDGAKQHKERTLSAWVPEEHIHAVPAHNIDPNHEFHDKLKSEHEVVVAPHKFNYATPEERKTYHANSEKQKLI